MSDLTELEAAAKAATPGDRYRVGDTVYAHGAGHPLLRVYDIGKSLGQPEADARFIALANPAAILELLSERLALLARVGELEGERDRLKALCESPWSDREDEHTPAINAAHPETTKDHNTYWTALQMVGARHGKYDLVNLTNWLLARALSAEVTLRASQEALGKAVEGLEMIGDEYRPPSPPGVTLHEALAQEYRRIKSIARQTLAQIRGVGEPVQELHELDGIPDEPLSPLPPQE